MNGQSRAKDGNGQPATYVGYLIEHDATFGTYLSPFINPKSGNPKDISHISVYYREGGSEITPTPEPGTWLLLDTGLLGMVGYGWRRKSLQTA